MTVSFRKQRNEFHKFLEQQDVGPDLDKFVVTGQCWRIHKVGSVNGGRAAVFSLLRVTATRVTASSIKQGLHDERSGRLVDVTLCTRPTVIASTHAYSKTKKTPPIDLTLLSIMKILKIPINLNSRKGLHSNWNNEESYGTFVNFDTLKIWLSNTPSAQCP